MDWFLYDNGLRHEKVKCVFIDILNEYSFGFRVQEFNAYWNEFWMSLTKRIKTSLIAPSCTT